MKREPSNVRYSQRLADVRLRLHGVIARWAGNAPRSNVLRRMAVRVITVILLAIAVSGCDQFSEFVDAEPWKWSAPGVVETKRRGDIVCHAVEAYREKTGKYPSRLEDLQPEFLREIPQPTVGHNEWAYMLRDQGTNYWLHVVASEWGPSLGKKADEPWQYTD